MKHANVPGLGLFEGGGTTLPMKNRRTAWRASSDRWKGWDVKENLFGDGAPFIGDAVLRHSGGYMGTIHEQRFYAIRANGGDVRFPFPSGPFTALVDLSRSVDDVVLRGYAEALIQHGCVQAVCRGEESARLEEIFNDLANDLAEKGDIDPNGPCFTSMCMDDEPLDEAIQYFVLPCGLAQIGLLMVIGDQGDFQNAIEGFSIAAGAIREDLSAPVYTEDDLVCFVSS